MTLSDTNRGIDYKSPIKQALYAIVKQSVNMTDVQCRPMDGTGVIYAKR